MNFRRLCEAWNQTLVNVQTVWLLTKLPELICIVALGVAFPSTLAKKELVFAVLT